MKKTNKSNHYFSLGVSLRPLSSPSPLQTTAPHFSLGTPLVKTKDVWDQSMQSLLNKFLEASYKEHKSEHDSHAPRFVEGGGGFLDPSLGKIETQFLRHNLSLRYLRGNNVYYKLIIFVLRLLSDKIAQVRYNIFYSQSQSTNIPCPLVSQTVSLSVNKSFDHNSL